MRANKFYTLVEWGKEMASVGRAGSFKPGKALLSSQTVPSEQVLDSIRTNTSFYERGSMTDEGMLDVAEAASANGEAVEIQISPDALSRAASLWALKTMYPGLFAQMETGDALSRALGRIVDYVSDKDNLAKAGQLALTGAQLYGTYQSAMGNPAGATISTLASAGQHGLNALTQSRNTPATQNAAANSQNVVNDTINTINQGTTIPVDASKTSNLGSPIPKTLMTGDWKGASKLIGLETCLLYTSPSPRDS